MICRTVQFKHQNAKTKTLIISLNIVLISLLKLARVNLASMLAALSRKEERRVYCLFMMTRSWPFLFLSLVTLFYMNSVWFLTKSKGFRCSPCCRKGILSEGLGPRLRVQTGWFFHSSWIPIQVLPGTVGQLISWLRYISEISGLWTDV